MIPQRSNSFVCLPDLYWVAHPMLNPRERALYTNKTLRAIFLCHLCNSIHRVGRFHFEAKTTKKIIRLKHKFII